MLLVLFLYISTIFSLNAAQHASNATYNCTVPAHPKHGVLIVTEPASTESYPAPGDKLAHYYVELFCDLGYADLGVSHQRCTEDGEVSGNTNFECLPFCEAQADDRILSCGGEPRCIKTDICQPVNPRFLGDTPQDEECGVIPSRASRSILGTGPYAPYISGGRKAASEELPWHTGVYSKTKRPYMQICGGSLLSHTVVISAAHCFWGEQKQLPASNYAVAAGKLYRPWNDPHDGPAQKSDVAEIKIPPYFRGHTTNLQDDIALLFVSTPFIYTTGVRPVCLDFDQDKDREELAPGRLGRVGGWGLTSEDGPASPVLKVVDLPVVDLEQCFQQSDPAFRAHITSDKICAGYQNGTAVCKGDSGGGLAFLPTGGKRERYTLRGVVSGAPQSDHLCNTMAWASFTHLLSHERFIRDTMAAGSAE